jgi:hypothetical protein
LVNFNVASGHVPPSELAHVYLTSAGPVVVMVPEKFIFTGHAAVLGMFTPARCAAVTRVSPRAGGLGPGLATGAGCCAELKLSKEDIKDRERQTLFKSWNK